MKRQQNLIRVLRVSPFRLDPSLTGEEGIALRALASGQSEVEVCRELGMNAMTFLRLTRDLREKTGAADNVSLIAWAKRNISGVDQRIEGAERYARPA
jgi:DNA-binding CsgD family transcriptional regulator